MNTTSRIWLAGFLPLGVLLGMLGSLIVAWQYQIDVAPELIGLHFLALNAGYVVAAGIAQNLLRRISPRSLALGASAVSCGGLLALAFAAPPVAAIWRLTLLGITGFGAGSLGTSLMYAFEPSFQKAAASSLTRAGVLFGCGCLLATSIVGAVYLMGRDDLGTVLLAAVLAIFMLALVRMRPSDQMLQLPSEEHERVRRTLRDLRSIATVLFSLLLFFQFGNEWAIAGWLPLFLIHRLGSNPALAIGVLGVYFLTLLFGRVVASKLLPFANHRRLLIGSVSIAVCGMLLLSYAQSLPVATAGATVIGTGFAPIYPLVAEQLDDRFSYHPGFYNGAVSVAITGAMSAPWLLGFVDAFLGMKFVMLLPALGSMIVLLVSLLLMLEAHVMGSRVPVPKPLGR